MSIVFVCERLTKERNWTSCEVSRPSCDSIIPTSFLNWFKKLMIRKVFGSLTTLLFHRSFEVSSSNKLLLRNFYGDALIQDKSGSPIDQSRDGTSPLNMSQIYPKHRNVLHDWGWLTMCSNMGASSFCWCKRLIFILHLKRNQRNQSGFSFPQPQVHRQ